MRKKLTIFTYKSEVVRVIDGDTIVLDCDIGFHLTKRIKGRILDLNTPEIRGKEKKEGLIYKQAAINILDTEKKIIVMTSKKGKYGRWLVDIFIDGIDFKKLLLKEVKILKDL